MTLPALRLLWRLFMVVALLGSAAPHEHARAGTGPATLQAAGLHDHDHHHHHDDDTGHEHERLEPGEDEPGTTFHGHDHKAADHLHDQPCPVTTWCTPFRPREAVWRLAGERDHCDKLAFPLDRPPRIVVAA